MRYFIKRKGAPEREVSREEYIQEANENNPGFGVPTEDTPMIFVGKTASGHIDAETLGKMGWVII